MDNAWNGMLLKKFLLHFLGTLAIVFAVLVTPWRNFASITWFITSSWAGIVGFVAVGFLQLLLAAPFLIIFAIFKPAGPGALGARLSKLPSDLAGLAGLAFAMFVGGRITGRVLGLN